MFVPPFYSVNPLDANGEYTVDAIGEADGVECESACERQRNMGLCCSLTLDDCVTISVYDCDQRIIIPFTVVRFR